MLFGVIIYLGCPLIYFKLQEVRRRSATKTGAAGKLPDCGLRLMAVLNINTLWDPTRLPVHSLLRMLINRQWPSRYFLRVITSLLKLEVTSSSARVNNSLGILKCHQCTGGSLKSRLHEVKKFQIISFFFKFLIIKLEVLFIRKLFETFYLYSKVARC